MYAMDHVKTTAYNIYREESILLPYVTVHAKTSLVQTKIENHFFSPAYSYTH